jgi:ParB family chromosome partitioning protein
MSKIVWTDIKKLIPYEKNPRKNQPIDSVVKSIKEFGFTNPILVDKNNTIVAGHTRYKAAQQMKLKLVPTIVLELTDDKIKAYRILDNKLGEMADWDNFLFETELKELEELGLDLKEWELDFNFHSLDMMADEVAEKEVQLKEKPKQLTFIYQDPSKYAKHFEKIQEIKYKFGFDTDEQIVEALLSNKELYK